MKKVIFSPVDTYGYQFEHQFSAEDWDKKLLTEKQVNLSTFQYHVFKYDQLYSVIMACVDAGIDVEIKAK